MFFIFPLMNYTRYTSNEPFDPIYIFYQTPFIFWIVLGAIWTQENLESNMSFQRQLLTQMNWEYSTYLIGVMETPARMRSSTNQGKQSMQTIIGIQKENMR